jgi:hypothetical protein
VPSYNGDASVRCLVNDSSIPPFRYFVTAFISYVTSFLRVDKSCNNTHLPRGFQVPPQSCFRHVFLAGYLTTNSEWRLHRVGMSCAHVTGRFATHSVPHGVKQQYFLISRCADCVVFHNYVSFFRFFKANIT